MKGYHIFFIAVILKANFVFGQYEPVQSLSVQQQLYNASFFGLNAKSEAGAVYNRIKINETQGLNTQYVFGSFAFHEHAFSLGADFRSLENESLALKENLARMSFVYHLPLSSYWYALPSLTLGYTQFSTLSERLILEDQIDAFTGFTALQSSDPLVSGVQLNVNYFNLNAGLLVHNNNYVFGFAVHHLNRPNVSFNAETVDKIPMRFVLQSIGEWALNSSRLYFLANENYFRLYTLFSSEEKDFYARFGEVVQLGGFYFGATQSINFKDNARTTVYGINFGVRWEQINLGIQYNLPRNTPNKTFNPSVFELSAVFKIFTKSRAVMNDPFKEIHTEGY